MFYSSSSRAPASRSSGNRSFASSRGGGGGRGFGGSRAGGFGGRGGRGGRGGMHRQKTVDIALLTRKAVSAPVMEVTPTVATSFNDFLIAPWLKEIIAARGYKQPTPIQDQTIPHLLEGKDLVGIANTGTGKTAAFLIPSLHKIVADRSQRVLIIAPTRELAAQIKQEVIAFTPNLRLSAALCIGGVNMYHQIEALRRNPDFVIGTPGRLKDLKNQGRLNLNQFSTIILDEVDRMLDMGFITDIRFLLSFMPEKRQSIFFSATLSPAINTVISTFLRDPVRISVKSQETSLNVDQEVIRLQGREKILVLHELLQQTAMEKVIIFGRTKRGIEKLADQLYQRGFDIESLHSNKSQNQRLRALDNFKRNRVSILLATDVAARGLDIADVTHVINYDLPEDYDAYVHRIGRTGRANKKGVALTLAD